LGPPLWGQNFGSAISLTRKRIVLERKLPPTGRIDGTGIKVVVNSVGIPGDVATTLHSNLEDILLRNDPRLRSEDVHPDTVVTCTITSYAQPAPARTQQSTVSFNKNKPAPPQYMERVTGTLAVGFKAESSGGHTVAADNVKSNYDREFNVAANGTANTGITGIFHSVTSAAGHVSKTGSNSNEDAPPTQIELRNWLIQNAAIQKLMAPGIASGSVAPATLEHIRQGSGRIIFTASGVNEESLESDSIKHGYFTYYLVQALEQQDGGIPLTDAFAFVQQHVRARADGSACRTEPRAESQSGQHRLLTRAIGCNARRH